MLLSVFQYSHLATKSRAMIGKMLNHQDYQELVNKKSVHEVAAYLKNNTHYKSLLEGVNESTIHRGKLENIFKKALITDYEKLLKFTKGQVKVFLKIAFLRYEIEDLKMIIRILETEHDTQLLQDSLMFLEKYTTVDIKKLIESKNMQQFISNLKGSPYYDVLLPLIENKQELNLFNIEMALDMYFFRLILKEKERLLSGEDYKVIDHSLGSEIDILNILWIYRAKKLYKIPRETIYNNLIPERYSINKSQIAQMVDAKNLDEVKRVINSTRYKEVFDVDSDHFYEVNYLEYIYKMNKRFLRQNTFSIASLTVFLHLKEIELRNIISIIEGIRYQLPPEKIVKYVVGVN